MHINPETGAARPDDITETPFSDDDTYGTYVAIFMKCSDAAKSNISSDVLEESSIMLAKMRGLMHPILRCKVEYSKSAKDLSNVWHKWNNNQAVGTRDFVPDVNDQYKLWSALRIFYCAAEEVKAIPT